MHHKKTELRGHLQDNRQITPLTLFKCNVIIFQSFECTLLYTLLFVFLCVCGLNEFTNTIIIIAENNINTLYMTEKKPE